MNEQQQLNYNRIAEAIEYIKANFKVQPELDEIAQKIHLSPFHFHRLFSEWAGTTPKKFLQYLCIQQQRRPRNHSSKRLRQSLLKEVFV